MNPVREIIGNVFQSPMQNMSFVAYFSYVNESGKITARSVMDTQAVVLTILEAQEKKNAEFEANFKEIEAILQKLVGKKVEEVVKPIEPPIELKQEVIPEKPFVCPECGKSFKVKVALAGHQRSHKASIPSIANVV